MARQETSGVHVRAPVCRMRGGLANGAKQETQTCKVAAEQLGDHDTPICAGLELRSLAAALAANERW